MEEKEEPVKEGEEKEASPFIPVLVNDLQILQSYDEPSVLKEETIDENREDYYNENRNPMRWFRACKFNFL